MSILKEINELHFTFKSFAIVLLLSSALFYIDIFFLKRHFFTTSPIYIPIVLSIVMSIMWGVANMTCLIFSPVLKDNDKAIYSQENFHVVFFLTNFIWLSAVSTICIYYNVSFKNFFHTLIIVFAFRLFILIVFRHKIKNWYSQ
jgi:hypothetical protein